MFSQHLLVWQNLTFTNPCLFSLHAPSPLKLLYLQYSLTQHKLYCVRALKPRINRWGSEEMALKVRLCISVFQALSDGSLGRLDGWTVLISWFPSLYNNFRQREDHWDRGGCFSALEGCNCHKGVKQRNYFFYPFQITVRQYQSLTFFLTFLSIKAE